jgi:plastocyanin
MRPVHRLVAVLLAAVAGWGVAQAALAIAPPHAATAAAKPSSHHKARRRCTTRKRKGHREPHKAARCPAKHSSTKHPSTSTLPSTSTSSAGGEPASSSTESATSPAPVTGTETPITPKPPEVPRVQVTAVEYKYTLSRTTVPAGKIILEFDDKGQDEHNLNVLGGEGELSARFANEQPGGVSEETVDLKPGSYMLFCSLPEHEAKGMKATLVVE